MIWSNEYLALVERRYTFINCLSRRVEEPGRSAFSRLYKGLQLDFTRSASKTFSRCHQELKLPHCKVDDERERLVL